MTGPPATTRHPNTIRPTGTTADRPAVDSPTREHPLASIEPVPTVEVLIVSYNTAALVADCLESLMRHLPSPEVAHVSVALLDNASSDGTADLVRSRYPFVRLLASQENVGFARGNNRLAETSEADYLLLLNSDTQCPADVITPLLQVLRTQPDVSLVGPRLVFPDGCVQYSSERFPNLRFEVARALRGTKADVFTCGYLSRRVRYVRNADQIERRQTHRTDFLWATCWMLTRSEVREHTLFDEYFVTYDEDLDFCLRLRRRGREILYLASCELIHLGGASSTSDAKLRLMLEAREKYYRRSKGPLAAAVYRGAIGAIQSLKHLRGVRSSRRLFHRPDRKEDVAISTRNFESLKEAARAQKPWNLDAEMRYRPVVERLPALDLPICEVGSGPRGLAVWTVREVIGIDPGPDDPHGSQASPANFTRLAGEGASIPLADRSVAAAVAVDTFEHIPREGRAAVVQEMKRIVCDGGRVIIIGPVGDDAARFDHRVLECWRARGETENIVHWLSEHEEIGLPTVDELVDYIGTERVTGIRSRGVLNVTVWWMMHRALLGDFSRTRGSYLLQSALTPAFSRFARAWRRGPYYRYLIFAEIGPSRA